MGGLTSSLMMAVQALIAEQGALSVTSNNIANVNTPGYSREAPTFTDNPPVQMGDLMFGQGVNLKSIDSIRDRLLELRILGETQQQSNAGAQLGFLNQVQGLFSNTSQNIGTDITAFFNSLTQLSTDPTSLPLRQAVLTAASNLAADFHNTVNQLDALTVNLNQNVVQSVNDINRLTSEIAKLNAQVGTLKSLGKDAGVLEDQRNELVNQLAQLTEVHVISTEQGDTITTGNGTALVVGGQSFELQAGTAADGAQHVFALGQDITASLTGGRIGGFLSVRDQAIPDGMKQLDDLAGGLATNFNTAHHGGFDLNGAAGQDFFAPITGTGAARNFALAITDPAAIAASSDGSPGSSGNITNLLAVQTNSLPSGKNPGDAYAALVFTVGDRTAQVKAESTASSLSLQQLQDQRQGVSGVSLDEEATNLIRYQHAFSAAARIITTVDEMTQTVIAMGSPTG
ncbi:MAG TPA: flagellar hook-associated protein FlgK [Terriglobales bacterium]|nr:flagellar hook-associated protein FlgK [Terriglobales bacterium]